MDTCKHLTGEMNDQGYLRSREPGHSAVWTDDILECSFVWDIRINICDYTDYIFTSPRDMHGTPHLHEWQKMVRETIGHESIIDRSGIGNDGAEHRKLCY